jgi:hypothetical protein
MAVIQASDTGQRPVPWHRSVSCPHVVSSEGAMAIFVCGVINRSDGQPWLVLGTLGT